MATRGELRDELRAWMAELRAPITLNGEVVRQGVGAGWTDEQCLFYIARSLGATYESRRLPRPADPPPATP